MEQKTNIKSGDIVRLTDPSSNGEVVRVEKVDEHGYVNWLDSYSPQSLDIYTLGQLRMFLAIEGLDNIVEQLK